MNDKSKELNESYEKERNALKKIDSDFSSLSFIKQCMTFWSTFMLYIEKRKEVKKLKKEISASC